jgi:hypothetical protein
MNAWVPRKVGDHVTMDVREVIDHDGDASVRARDDAPCDKIVSWGHLQQPSPFNGPA